MKTIKLNTDHLRYDLMGGISFKDTEGNSYKAGRKETWELATLVLEALGMDICERDDLLFSLEKAV